MKGKSRSNFSAQKTRRYIFPRKMFYGHISYGENALPIQFQLCAGLDSRLKISMRKYNAQMYIFLNKNNGEVGQTIEEFIICAESKDQKIFKSDSISICSIGFNKTGYYASLTARSATITEKRKDTGNEIFLRLWLRSFTSHINPVIESTLGRVIVRGSTRIKSCDDVSGFIAVVSDSDKESDEWRIRCDDMIRHIHQGMSFAHGGRLQTPMLEYFSKEYICITFFAGTGHPPELANQHFLNHTPFIEALINRYETGGKLPEIIWTALGWMQTTTTFDEIRFISAMTAVEALVDNLLQEKSKSFLPKKTFSSLKTELHKNVDDATDIDNDSKGVLKGKINGLNQRVLSQKIFALMENYSISREKFDQNTVISLTNLRNAIIHKGEAPDKYDIWKSIILCRELVGRIIMREIGFEGSYRCYIDGDNQREFVD